MKYIVSRYSNREEEPLEGFKEGSNMSRLQLSQHHPGYCVAAAIKGGGSESVKPVTRVLGKPRKGLSCVQAEKAHLGCTGWEGRAGEFAGCEMWEQTMNLG